jgi:hypothetical protein
MHQGEFYQQGEGTAIKSPISPLLANIFMTAFKDKAIGSSLMKQKCWPRHVEDISAIWPQGPTTLRSFLSHLNYGLPKVRLFSLELERDHQLQFLNVLYSPHFDNSLGYAIYRKPTHNGRHLQAAPHHPTARKRFVITTLRDRARKICDNSNQPSELQHVKSVPEPMATSSRTSTELPRPDP